jgi:EmrB/QacA subfamily drug resistance transporter
MKNKWLVLISVGLGFFLVNFDGGSIGILLPTLQTFFSTSFYQVQWITLAGLLTIVVSLAVAGRFGDSIGKRVVFLAGTCIYLAGTVLIALASSVGLMTAFRVIQALGLTAFLGLGAAIITEAFEDSKRGLALGLYNLLGLLGILAGPVASGALLQYSSWRVIFWIGTGLAAVIFIVGLLFLPAVKEKKPVNLDIKGTIALFIGLAALLLALTLAQTKGFADLLVLGLLLLSIIGLVLFVWIESKTQDPIITISSFKNPVFSFNLIFILLSMLALNGYGFLMPFYLQNVLGLTTMQMGLILAVTFGLLMAIAAPIGGALSDKIGATKITLIGFTLLLAGTIASIGLNEDSTQLSVLLRFMPIGLGIGMIVTPTTSAIMGTLPKDRLGMGASLTSITINVAQSMGIAVLGTFWSGSVASLLGSLPEGGASTAPAVIQAQALSSTFIFAACILSLGLILNIWRLISESRNTAPKHN